MRALARRLHPQRIRRTLGAASCVRERADFVFRELRGIPVAGEYRLRDSGLIAAVRHPLLDMWVLEEVFRFRVYEPPAPVGEMLRSVGRPLRVLDLGGHVGCFGLFLRGLFPDAVVTSFEPDPDNAAILERCIERNALTGRWQLVQAAAATVDGKAELSGGYHLARIAEAADPRLDDLQRGVRSAFPFLEGEALLRSDRRRVASRDVFPFLEDADLVKIDIEGAEWEILADERFGELTAGAIVLEYHPAYAPMQDPEAAVQRYLERAGYVTGVPVSGADGGLLWGWKDPARTS